MEREIVFFSPWRGFTELVKKTAQEVKEETVDVVEVYRGECERIVRQLEGENRKVIIAKEYWVPYVESLKTRLLTFPIHVTTFDLMQNILAVIKKFKRIGYIGSKKEARYYDFPWLEKLLNIEIIPLLYTNDFDIEAQVNQLLNFNIEYVLTTGSCIVKLCKHAGVPAQVVCPGKESIVEAIYRVKELLAIYNQQRRYVQHFYTVTNVLPEGLMVLDQNKTITIMNTKASELFNCSLNEVLGRNVGELVFLPFIREIIGDGRPVTNKPLELNNQKVLMNRYPLLTDNVNEGILITFEAEKRSERINKKNGQSGEGMRTRFQFSDIIGKSEVILSAVNQAKRFAQSESTILITGESGTGKELFAQSIHNYSQRKDGPFVAINCAALPETLLESELFGYEKGAFTGAEKAGKPGLFEVASGGTIFLDEITELPFALQSKLLRVLQEHEIRRIGGKTTIPVNMRVIAATNQDLKKEVGQGKFRIDLYYRLNVLKLNIPPLRERKEDILELFSCFLHKNASRLGMTATRAAAGIAPAITPELLKYDWPGNVRELENFVERYVLCADDPDAVYRLCKEFFKDGSAYLRQEGQHFPGFTPKYLKIKLGTLEEMENQILEQLIYKYRVRKNDLAKILGVSRTTLWRKIKDEDK